MNNPSLGDKVRLKGELDRQNDVLRVLKRLNYQGHHRNLDCHLRECTRKRFYHLAATNHRQLRLYIKLVNAKHTHTHAHTLQ